jgi:hypothetical protein
MPLAAMLIGNFVMFVISARKIYIVTQRRKQLVSGSDKNK